MNLLDQFISYWNPEAGLRRARARAAEDLVRKYDGATRGRRGAGWGEAGTSANGETALAIKMLRDRARELVRNNPHAKSAIDVITTNTIGTGIRLTVKDAAGNVNAPVRDAWMKWAETTACDYNGQFDFYGLQRMVMRAVAESGEALVVRRFGEGPDGKRTVQLQVLEGDYLDHSKDADKTESGGRIIQGVEFDQNGKRIKYLLYNAHPGDGKLGSAVVNPVNAEDVLHIYNVERPGQVRGVPFGVSAMLRLRDLGDYQDAQLIRQKIAACFAVFIQDSAADAIVSNNTTSSDLPERVEPGMIEKLPTGKTVTFAAPPAAEGYADYTKKVLQEIAAGYGVTYESMTGDLSNVNFSSGRMGWLEFHRRITDWQWNIIIPMFCEGVWNWWKTINAPTAQLQTEWTTPRREMIDPVKEVEGLSKQVRNGFMSWSEALRQQGYEPSQVLAEIAKDMKAFDDAGVKLDSDARNGGDSSSGSGAQQQEQQPAT